MGYCYYHLQDYELAANSYAKLVQQYPYVSQYRIYYIQSLLKSGDIEEAKHVDSRRENGYELHNMHYQQQQQRSQHELMLQANIKFEERDYNGCRSILNQCVSEDPETMVAHASLHVKDGNYEEALELYSEAFNIQGYDAEIAYHIALCYYMLKEYQDALETINEIIERAIESFPEFTPKLSEENNDEEDDVYCDNETVSNSLKLQETYLIESYNLRAAIEYDMGDITKAMQTLKTMPQRKEEELDPVTLHNQGLMNIEVDVGCGFEKLKFLLSNPPFPPETFGNLLLLYCKFGHHDMSADIMAENSHLTYDFLTEDLFEYLDTVIMTKANPDEAMIRLETEAKKYSLELRKLTHELESKDTSNDKEMNDSRARYDHVMTFFIPILMALASIYWQREEYFRIEQLFRKNADLCVDIDAWRLNVAHTFFIQGGKYKDSIKYYETFVNDKGSESILNIAPIILANLCVSYIMTNQNDEAEEIIKRIDTEEEIQRRNNNKVDLHKHHSCIVNLVIGTLYCEKGNFEFGISRICKSLEPIETKLAADTWFYAKRCLLSLTDQMAKQMILLNRISFKEIIDFLDDVICHGDHLAAKIEDYKIAIEDTPCIGNHISISSEARQLKSLFIKLMK